MVAERGDTDSSAQAPVTPAGIRRRLLGIEIDAVDLSEACDRCEAAVANRRSLVVGVVNAAKLVKLQSDPLLRDSILHSDLVIAD